MEKDHERRAHPDFARGHEDEDHATNPDEPRPDFARGVREGEPVIFRSEQGDFAEGTSEHPVSDAPHGDYARGTEVDDEAEHDPDE